MLLLPLLVSNSLGYSLFSAGGWCFIASDKAVGGSQVGLLYQYANYDLSAGTIFKILVGGKAVEISAYFIVFALYGLSSMDIRRKVSCYTELIACTSNFPSNFLSIEERITNRRRICSYQLQKITETNRTEVIRYTIRVCAVETLGYISVYIFHWCVC